MVADSRDTLQAYRFVNRRVATALLEGDAESGNRPLARLGLGSYAGIFLTIALLGIAGVIGVVRPAASTAWQEPGSFIVEEETGVRFVYLDGILHPVLNYASAKLLLGNRLQVVTAAQRSLQTAPRGPIIGIPTAPDSLPDAAHIVGTSWSVCAMGSAADDQPYRTAMFPGRAAVGTTMADDDAYLALTTSGRYSLIWSGHAFAIPDMWLAALGYPPATALPVGDDFVAALPAGQQIAPPEVPRLGQSGPALPGAAEPTVIGTIYADQTNTYHLMTQDGLATLTLLQAQLLLADPRLTAAYAGSNPSPLPISQVQMTAITEVPLPALGAGAAAPTTVPELTAVPDGVQQLCVRYADQQVPQIALGPADEVSMVTGLVQLPTGSGALVAARPDPETPGATVYLVTDTGTRFPVADRPALDQLGLAGVTVAQLPATLVGLLPAGVLLSEEAAAATPAN
jgi:type VII secretion protein EccB